MNSITTTDTTNSTATNSVAIDRTIDQHIAMSPYIKREIIAEVIRRDLCVTIESVDSFDYDTKLQVHIYVSKHAAFGSYSLQRASEKLSEYFKRSIIICVSWNNLKDCFEFYIELKK
jgi:hypothetical protein